MPSLKIYNHNIRWSSTRKQHLAIAHRILELQPDIVCLQEVALETQAKIFQIPGYRMHYITVEKPKMALVTNFIKPIFSTYKSLENTLLYKTNKATKTAKTSLLQRVKNIKNSLASPTTSHNKSSFLKGYLLILTRDKPDQVIYKKFKTQGSLVNNLAERVAGKGFLKLDYPQFDLYNTHLLSSHKKQKQEHDSDNSSQLVELLDFANIAKNTVLVGDFNFGPNTTKYKLTNYLEDLTKDIPVTEYYWKTRLDYVFVNFKPKYSSSHIVRYSPEPSDHYGIWCEIEF